MLFRSHHADPVGEALAEVVFLGEERRPARRLRQLAGLRSRPAGWEAAPVVLSGRDAVAGWSRGRRPTPGDDPVGGLDWVRLAGRLRRAPGASASEPPSPDLSDERPTRSESDVHEGYAS